MEIFKADSTNKSKLQKHIKIAQKSMNGVLNQDKSSRNVLR